MPFAARTVARQSASPSKASVRTLWPPLLAAGIAAFVGCRTSGVLTLGVADDAQALVQLASGHGRTLQIPLPSGTTTVAQLVLAASPVNAPRQAVVAAFTAVVPGGRTRVYAARLPNAACTSCTLAFEAPVDVSPNLDGATMLAGTEPLEPDRHLLRARGRVRRGQLWVARARRSGR